MLRVDQVVKTEPRRVRREHRLGLIVFKSSGADPDWRDRKGMNDASGA